MGQGGRVEVEWVGRAKINERKRELKRDLTQFFLN